MICVHSGGASVCCESESGTILFEAAASGNPDIISMLLDHGADPNRPLYSGHLPIHRVAYHGHILWGMSMLQNLENGVYTLNHCHVLNEDSSSTGLWSTSSQWRSWMLWRKAGWALSILQPPVDTLIVWRCCSKLATIQTSCCIQGCAATMMMSASRPSSLLSPTTISSAPACC